MRVISGRFKGFSLDTPKTGTRPTTDRVKEALFSHLDNGGYLSDARVLDLFAGTGALAFEALSRGAQSALVVDSAPAAVSLLKNAASRITRVGAWDPDIHISVRRGKAAAIAERLTPADNFSLVFLDPPYEYSEHDFDALLVQLSDCGALGEDAIIVAERSSRSADPVPPQGWEVEQSRNYGETAVTYFVRSGAQGPK
ncbi:MAG: 16S rRNA (guanine(966)-N(2))-methyltransferase RsmD [Bifidobacteriaceae bacterium]|jgi:16S rRNA (guanine966-N2)-methyltransferase|nr:16S rRNA (guanine(966)-N(2))-methyltransferase RsmD [Bifidobacteriaceae bacterium]MCI1914281.1 16S rRNA (guanine(966)-N(2))-methyltransferase RsmD [Bifidobacteriaceae bacterium]